MPGLLAPAWVLQFLDQSGRVLAGGKVSVYLAGTTTPATVYKDANLTLTHTNPVILDAAGRATIFLARGSYKFEIRNSVDVLEWPPVDNVTTIDQLLLTIDSYLEFQGQSSPPAVSGPSAARVYFDLGRSQLRVSTAGGAYAALVAPVVIPLGGDYTATITDTAAFGPLADAVSVEIDGVLLASRPGRLEFMAEGTGTVRLVDASTGAVVAGSTAPVSATSPTMYVVGGIVLPASVAPYRVQAQASGAGVRIWSARLVFP